MKHERTMVRWRIAFVVWFCVVAWVGAAEEKKAAELNSIRLYVPIPELDERFGKDSAPALSRYIKSLEKRAGEVLEKEQKPAAKGLLVAVGIKSKSKTRVWCEAVEGDVPAEVLARLEQELGKVEAVDMVKGPGAFGLEVKLFGQKPEKFPLVPEAWRKAAEEKKVKVLIPPDELFKVIWAE